MEVRVILSDCFAINLFLFRWPHSVILEKEGPADCLVSVKSSKWVHPAPSLNKY
jgi:hypothetical protein